MMKLRPDTIKFLVIAGVLAIILILSFFGGGNQKEPVNNGLAVKELSNPVIEIVKTSASQKLFYVNGVEDQKRIIVLDPTKTDMEIMNELSLEKSGFDASRIIIPGAVAGRQVTDIQEAIDQLYYDTYLESQLNPVYAD